ncbi:MAG: ferritin-like domain-containing protein [Pseudomonadota bacterium]
MTTTHNAHQAAQTCLLCADVADKVTLAQQLWHDWQADQLVVCEIPLTLSLQAGQPQRPALVPPNQLVRRRLRSRTGQAALIHAVAHIEFNAINLACDAASRFQGLPAAYYADWVRVAAEEAKHFALLQARLHELGYTYGDFPAHNGLWELAQQTADNFVQRMALVPRVMEARGLDVTPGMMERFHQIGDTATAEVLAVILQDEIGHVAVGTRWFQYACAQHGLDPEAHYLHLLSTEFRHLIRGPLHTEARLEAGFSPYEIDQLNTLCTAGKTHSDRSEAAPVQGRHTKVV